MKTIDIIIICITLVQIGLFFLLNKFYKLITISLFILAIVFLFFVFYSNYREVIDLFWGSEAGTSSIVPEIIKSEYFTFTLFVLYSFLNTVLMSLKKTLNK